MKIFYRFNGADSVLMIVSILFSPLYALLLRSSLLVSDAMPMDIEWATASFYRIFRLNLSFSRYQQEPVSTEFIPVYVNTFIVGLFFTALIMLVRIAWIFLAERKLLSQQGSDYGVATEWVRFPWLTYCFSC